MNRSARSLSLLTIFFVAALFGLSACDPGASACDKEASCLDAGSSEATSCTNNYDTVVKELRDDGPACSKLAADEDAVSNCIAGLSCADLTAFNGTSEFNGKCDTQVSQLEKDNNGVICNVTLDGGSVP